MIFFICRTEHFNLLEKILKSLRAYFHFINGTTNTERRHEMGLSESNQIKSKSKSKSKSNQIKNQIKNKTLS